jgi:uncharacterized membrane protein (UPF0127 family)
MMIAPLAIALLLGTSGCRGNGSANATAPTSQTDEAVDGEVELLVRTASGQNHHFIAELAVDEASQAQGLMGRASLADDRGMLFPFPVPNMASFWMKNTPLPLDLLFIRPDGTIAAILQGKPNDLHPISAGEAVSAVLEIKQGRAQALGIAPGDRVQWGNCDGDEPASKVAWQAERFCLDTSN